MGHEKEDQLLIQIAKRLESFLQKGDILARFGNDEFLIYKNSITDLSEANALGEKLNRIFSECFTLNNELYYFSASIGISIFPVDGESSEELIKNADIAKNIVKEKGKNNYLVCSQEMKDKAYYDLILSTSVKRAVERDELFMMYQPQVDVKTGEIKGVESLIRWEHPTLGLIPPGAFIEIAEKNGAIVEIGQWIFRTVFKQIKKWE